MVKKPSQLSQFSPKVEGALADFIASGFGIGYLPIPARATLASAIAVLAFWFMPFDGESLWMILLIGSTATVGTWAAWRTLRPGEDDPKRVVIDEFAGMWMTFIFIPKEWYLAVAAFLLFRLFDVWKPLGIARLERLPGGVGIMADDVGAGLLGAVILNVAWFIFQAVSG